MSNISDGSGQTNAPLIRADRTTKVVAWAALAVGIAALANTIFGPVRISFSVGENPQVAAAAPAPVVAQPNPVAAASLLPIAPQPQQQQQIQLPTQQAAAPAPNSMSIRMYSHQGQMFAHDPSSDSWFGFTSESSEPLVISAAQVPPEVLNGQVPPLALDQQVQPTQELEQAAISSLEATVPGADPELRINILLDEPDVAGSILEALDQLPGIQVNGGPNDDSPLYIFYDPRCPYCHAAYRELKGKVSMRLLPTLALGEGAEPLSSAILGPLDVTRTADGAIESVTLADDPDRVTRIDDALHDRTARLRTVPYDPASPEAEAHDFALAETYTVMRQLYGKQQALVAVPTVIMPRADGTARAYRGVDEDTIQAILVDAGAF